MMGIILQEQLQCLIDNINRGEKGIRWTELNMKTATLRS